METTFNKGKTYKINAERRTCDDYMSRLVLFINCMAVTEWRTFCRRQPTVLSNFGSATTKSPLRRNRCYPIDEIQKRIILQKLRFKNLRAEARQSYSMALNQSKIETGNGAVPVMFL